MRTGISLTLSPTDRQRLGALIRDRNAPQKRISASAVRRIWKAHGLQPNRWRQLKRSNDPQFIDKLRDVVGLYVDPLAHAIVLSVDEKSQIPGARPHPARPASQEGQARHHDPRLQAAWHDHAICRPQRARRHCHWQEHAASPPSGVHPLSQCRRRRTADRQGRPRCPR